MLWFFALNWNPNTSFEKWCCTGASLIWDHQNVSDYYRKLMRHQQKAKEKQSLLMVYFNLHLFGGESWNTETGKTTKFNGYKVSLLLLDRLPERSYFNSNHLQNLNLGYRYGKSTLGHFTNINNKVPSMSRWLTFSQEVADKVRDSIGVRCQLNLKTLLE